MPLLEPSHAGLTNIGKDRRPCWAKESTSGIGSPEDRTISQGTATPDALTMRLVHDLSKATPRVDGSLPVHGMERLWQTAGTKASRERLGIVPSAILKTMSIGSEGSTSLFTNGNPLPSRVTRWPSAAMESRKASIVLGLSSSSCQSSGLPSAPVSTRRSKAMPICTNHPEKVSGKRA